MFALIGEVSFSYLLSGIILSLVFGLSVGNYACSLVHRLPRRKPLLDKAPYCGSCGTLLGVKDLFPVFSALRLRHRCRYCGAPFPKSHTWTEALVGLLFVAVFLQYNFSEQYLLVAALGVSMIALAAVEINDRRLLGSLLACAAVSGLLYRVLADHILFNAFMGGLYGLLLGAALNYSRIRKAGHIYVLPPPALLMAVGGLCAGGQGLPLFLALFAGFYAAGRLLGKIPLSVPFALAVLLPLLYPAASRWVAF